ncbi:MAG: response regulator [Actinomycetota bacterium]
MNEPQQKARILVVDDDPEMVKVMSLVFELDGYTVFKANNGIEALRLVREEKPDCVLLDIMMPVMDGWEVLRRLSENPASMEIPVVIVTARTSDLDKIKGYGGGAREYLTKPFSPLGLKQVVERALQPDVRGEKSTHRAEMVRQLQLATIHDITCALVSTLDLQEVLDIIAGRLLSLFDLTLCGITLIARGGNRLRFAAAKSLVPIDSREMALLQVILEGLGSEYIDELRSTGRCVKTVNPHLDLREPSSLLNYLKSIYIFPLVAKKQLIGALTLTRDDLLQLGQGEEDLLYAICNQAAMAIENSRLYEDIRREEEAQRDLLHRVITAQEVERRRLAAELHDGIIQGLVGALYSQQYALARMEDFPAEARRSLEEAREVINTSITEMRHLINGLRPPLLGDMGLVKAMERYAISTSEASGFELFLELENSIPPLDPEAESGIYRIFQECLNNMAKHSDCRRGWVVMRVAHDLLVLEIRDDGRGFDTTDAVRPEGSYGLLGIKERVEYLKGDLIIASEPGQGTSVRVELPLREIRGDER